MCYSAEVSLGTFLFVEIICVFLWMRDRRIDRAAALILTVVVFMQFLEYLLWTDPECGTVNKSVSAILPYYLFLQPAAIAAILYAMNAGNGSFYPLIMMTSIPVMYMLSQQPHTECIKADENGHLCWKLNSGPMHHYISGWYFLSLFYTLATLKDKPLSAVAVTFSAVSLLVTYTYYKCAWGSIWCHSVNAMAVAALVL